MSLLALPYSLWPLVRIYLGTRELLELALTCRQLSALIERASFWTGLAQPDFELARVEHRQLLGLFRAACLETKVVVRSVQVRRSCVRSAGRLLRGLHVDCLTYAGDDGSPSSRGEEETRVAGLLSAVAAVRELKFRTCDHLTGVALSQLQRPAALGSLAFYGCHGVTNTGLAVMAGLSVRSLQLGGCRQITDAGLQALGALTALRQLDLSNCNLITDTGLAAVRGLADLEWLSFEYTNRITGAGLAQLASLPKLRRLYLSAHERAVDENTLNLLQGLPSLRSLVISGRGSLTVAGRRRRERPGLVVQWFED